MIQDPEVIQMIFDNYRKHAHPDAVTIEEAMGFQRFAAQAWEYSQRTNLPEGYSDNYRIIAANFYAMARTILGIE